MSLRIFQSDLFSPFQEYPLTKKFNDRRLTPLIAMTCAFVYAALVLFNLLTQGKTEMTESLLLSKPENSVDDGGICTTCQPASVNMGDSLYTVQAGNQEVPSDEVDVATFPGSFQWAIGEISNATDAITERTSSGLLYNAEVLDCNMTSASFHYQFPETNYKYNLCGSCLVRTHNFNLKLCTAFDLSTTNLPNFAKEFQESLQSRLVAVDSDYQVLSLGPHTLPLTAFPPAYSSNQVDLYGNLTYTNRDISQLSIWIGGVTFVPSPNYTFRNDDGGANLAPQGTTYVRGSEEPTNFFEAFAVTASSASSGFQLAVLGVGGVLPLGGEHNMTAIPQVLSNLFNSSFATLGWMMDVAVADLHERSLGVTYMCTRKQRKWKPLLTLISIAVGSSTGVFGAILTAMLVLARNYDIHQVGRQCAQAVETESLDLEERQTWHPRTSPNLTQALDR